MLSESKFWTASPIRRFFKVRANDDNLEDESLMHFTSRGIYSLGECNHVIAWKISGRFLDLSELSFEDEKKLTGNSIQIEFPECIAAVRNIDDENWSSARWKSSKPMITTLEEGDTFNSSIIHETQQLVTSSTSAVHLHHNIVLTIVTQKRTLYSFVFLSPKDVPKGESIFCNIKESFFYENDYNCYHFDSSDPVLSFCPLSHNELVLGDKKGYLSLVSYEHTLSSIKASEEFFSNEKSFVRRLTGIISKPLSVISLNAFYLSATPRTESIHYPFIISLHSDFTIRIYSAPELTPLYIFNFKKQCKDFFDSQKEPSLETLLNSRICVHKKVIHSKIYFLVYIPFAEDSVNIHLLSYSLTEGIISHISTLPLSTDPIFRFEFCSDPDTLLVAIQSSTNCNIYSTRLPYEDIPTHWYHVESQEILLPNSNPTPFYLSPFDNLFDDGNNDRFLIFKDDNISWLEVDRRSDEENKNLIEKTLNSIFPLQKSKNSIICDSQGINTVFSSKERKKFMDYFFTSPRYTKDILFSATSNLGCTTQFENTHELNNYIIEVLDKKIQLAKENHMNLSSKLIDSYFFTILLFECEKCLLDSISLISLQYSEKMGGFFDLKRDQIYLLHPITPLESTINIIYDMSQNSTEKLSLKEVKNELLFFFNGEIGMDDDCIQTLINIEEVISEFDLDVLYHFDESITNNENPESIAKLASSPIDNYHLKQNINYFRSIGSIIATVANMIGEQESDSAKYNVKLAPFYTSLPTTRIINKIASHTSHIAYIISRNLLLFCTTAEILSPLSSIYFDKIYPILIGVIKASLMLTMSLNKRHLPLPKFTDRFKGFIYSASDSTHNTIETLCDCTNAYIKDISPLSVPGSALFIKRLYFANQSVSKQANLLPPFHYKRTKNSSAYYHHWKINELFNKANSTIISVEKKQKEKNAKYLGFIDSNNTDDNEIFRNPHVIATQERIIEEILSILQSLEKFSPKKAISFISYALSGEDTSNDLIFETNVFYVTKKLQQLVDNEIDDDDIDDEQEDPVIMNETEVEIKEQENFEQTSFGSALLYILHCLYHTESLHAAAQTLALHSMMILEQRAPSDETDVYNFNKNKNSTVKIGETLASFAQIRKKSTDFIENLLSGWHWNDPLPNFDLPEFRYAVFTSNIRKNLHSILHCCLFHHALAIKDLDSAFHSMIENNNRERSLGCLDHFVFYCCKNNLVNKLIFNNYPALMEENVLAILENFFNKQDPNELFKIQSKISSNDKIIKDSEFVNSIDFASILHGFYLNKNDHSNAARILICYAMKLLTVPLSQEVLAKMHEILLLALNSLNLLPETNSWVSINYSKLNLVHHDLDLGNPSTSVLKINDHPIFLFPSPTFASFAISHLSSLSCSLNFNFQTRLCNSTFFPSIEYLTHTTPSPNISILTKDNIQAWSAIVSEALFSLSFYQTLINEQEKIPADNKVYLVDLHPDYICALSCAHHEYKRALTLASCLSSKDKCCNNMMIRFVIECASNELARKEVFLQTKKREFLVIVSALEQQNKERILEGKEDILMTGKKRGRKSLNIAKKKMRFSVAIDSDDDNTEVNDNEKLRKRERDELNTIIEKIEVEIKSFYDFFKEILPILEPETRPNPSFDTPCIYHLILVTALFEQKVALPSWLSEWMMVNCPITFFEVCTANSSTAALSFEFIETMLQTIFDKKIISPLMIPHLKHFCSVLKDNSSFSTLIKEAELCLEYEQEKI